MERTSYIKYNYVRQSQQININGQNIEQVLNIAQACCSECGRMLVQFQPNTSLHIRNEELRNNVSQQLVYCPSCGSKLYYDNLIIIDAEN